MHKASRHARVFTFVDFETHMFLPGTIPASVIWTLHSNLVYQSEIQGIRANVFFDALVNELLAEFVRERKKILKKHLISYRVIESARRDNRKNFFYYKRILFGAFDRRCFLSTSVDKSRVGHDRKNDRSCQRGAFHFSNADPLPSRLVPFDRSIVVIK